MKILFHVAVGNTDRPERWNAICMFFGKLSKVFTELGHDCMMYVHPKAIDRRFLTDKHVISEKVGKLDFVPDRIFTWNGISDGDKQMIKKYGREKFIFGELGLFDHYETCYFDLCGTNYTSMNMVEDVMDIYTTVETFNKFKSNYIKPRLYANDFIFVPLQDESDTQITKLSPFKTMYELLEYVLTIYNDSNMKILYKQHPRKRANVPKHPKLIEVTENVHHYIPYADRVVGINSTVLFETLIYHQRLLTLGLGIASRRFIDGNERMSFIMNCLSKQIHQRDLDNVEVIKNSWMYKNL